MKSLSLSKESLGRIGVAACALSLLDLSSLAMISFMGGVPYLPGLYPSILFVAMLAVASIAFALFGGRPLSLRAHKAAFYLFAFVAALGLLALWTAPALSLASFCAYSIGNAFLLFFLMELLLEVSSIELALAIVAGLAISTVGSLALNVIDAWPFACVITLLAALFCIKYLDETLGSSETEPQSAELGVDPKILSGTLCGLFLAGLSTAITQSITAMQDVASSMYPEITSIVAFALLAYLLLFTSDTNVSSAVKLISSLIVASLVLLLLSDRLVYQAYLLSSVAYALMSSLAYYVAVLVAKSRVFAPLRVFGVMGVMLSSGAIVLVVFALLGLNVADRTFIAGLALVFALAAIWLMGDRGIDQLVSPKQPAAASDDAGPLRFEEKIRSVAQIAGLTPREQDVFELAATGRSVPFIAEKLVLSENTVKSYLQKVYAKCGVHSRQELISLVEDAADA